MDYLFFEILFWIFGKIFMTLRYRDKERMEKVLNEKYDGRYDAVGLVIILNSVAAIGFVAMITALFFVIYALFTK